MSLKLSILKPYGVQSELENPNVPASARADMNGIYTLPTSLTPEEFQQRLKLRMLLRGNAKPGKHEADADHLFEAGKYGGGYFLTHDKRIHKLVDQIKKIIPSISVVTLKEFVEIALFYENANSPNP